MAKHNVFLYIGPDPLGPNAEVTPRVAEAGVHLPDVGSGDLDRAALEIMRTHKNAGLKRRDVEGAWAKVCRKSFKLKSDVLICLPGIHDASPEQAALALDGLSGLRVQLVTSSGTEAPAAWAKFLKPHHIHQATNAGQLVALALAEPEQRAARKRAKRERKALSA